MGICELHYTAYETILSYMNTRGYITFNHGDTNTIIMQ